MPLCLSIWHFSIKQDTTKFANARPSFMTLQRNQVVLVAELIGMLWSNGRGLSDKFRQREKPHPPVWLDPKLHRTRLTKAQNYRTTGPLNATLHSTSNIHNTIEIALSEGESESERVTGYFGDGGELGWWAMAMAAAARPSRPPVHWMDEIEVVSFILMLRLLLLQRTHWFLARAKTIDNDNRVTWP